MNIFKMPEEIAEVIKTFWNKYLLGEASKGTVINDADILILERDISRGTLNYNSLFCYSSKKYGTTEQDRLDFWIRVIRGDYNLYFEKFPKHQSIEVDGQIFMI